MRSGGVESNEYSSIGGENAETRIELPRRCAETPTANGTLRLLVPGTVLRLQPIRISDAFVTGWPMLWHWIVTEDNQQSAEWRGGEKGSSMLSPIAYARLTIVVIVSSAAAVVGCANMSTISRRTELPGEGIAIHLDAPQRVVFANKDGAVCAEPSPDALQAYAASLGASFSAPRKESAALATAFSENSASIGLRTQSITLMRDALYRICEAEHNKAIGHGDTVLLLERSQDLTLGVLAIEQLTGAVVARQAILTTGANADVSTNVNNTQAALDAARKDETAKNDALTKAKDAQTKQQAVVDADTKAAAASKAKAAPTQATIDKLTVQLPKDQAQVRASDAAASKTQGTLKDQTKAATLAEDLKKFQAAIPVDKAAVKKATDDLAAANTKVTADETQLKTDQAAQKTHQDAVTKDQDDVKKAKADVDVVQAGKDAAALTAAQAALAKDKDAVAADTAQYETAQKVTIAIDENLNAAIVSAHETATGAGAFSTGTDRNNLSKDTVAKIADATTAIVQTVLNKGHLTDECINLMSDYAKKGRDPNVPIAETMELCKEVIEADLLVYQKMLAGHPEAAAPAAAVE